MELYLLSLLIIVIGIIIAIIYFMTKQIIEFKKDLTISIHDIKALQERLQHNENNFNSKLNSIYNDSVKYTSQFNNQDLSDDEDEEDINLEKLHVMMKKHNQINFEEEHESEEEEHESEEEEHESEQEENIQVIQDDNVEVVDITNEVLDKQHEDEHHEDEQHEDEQHEDEHHEDEHHEDEHHEDEHHEDEHHEDEHHEDEHHEDEHHEDEHHEDEQHEDEQHVDEHHEDEQHEDKQSEDVQSDSVQSEDLSDSVDSKPKKKRYRQPSSKALNYEEGYQLVSENDGEKYEVIKDKKGKLKWKRLK